MLPTKLSSRSVALVFISATSSTSSPAGFLLGTCVATRPHFFTEWSDLPDLLKMLKVVNFLNKVVFAELLLSFDFTRTKNSPSCLASLLVSHQNNWFHAVLQIFLVLSGCTVFSSWCLICFQRWQLAENVLLSYWEHKLSHQMLSFSHDYRTSGVHKKLILCFLQLSVKYKIQPMIQLDTSRLPNLVKTVAKVFSSPVLPVLFLLLIVWDDCACGSLDFHMLFLSACSKVRFGSFLGLRSEKLSIRWLIWFDFY